MTRSTGTDHEQGPRIIDRDGAAVGAVSVRCLRVEHKSFV